MLEQRSEQSNWKKTKGDIQEPIFVWHKHIEVKNYMQNKMDTSFIRWTLFITAFTKAREKGRSP